MQGLYIHVPFCLKKCLYCDFYSVTDTGRIDDYVRALVREIHLRGGEDSGHTDTVYFGGGTPSLLEPGHTGAIIAAIIGKYHLQPDYEMTLEINPGTLVPGRLESYRGMGINRLSIGIQSFNDRNLGMLGRIHTASQACELIEAARRAGFGNLSIDLIYGLPGQDEKQWQRDLSKALSFSPEHLSCYMLTWEPGTPLHALREKGSMAPPDDDTLAAMYLSTRDILVNHGYEHYEISNFAKSMDTRSRHNLKYWNFEPYIGFGPSAHSFDPETPCRSWNKGDLSSYVATLGQDALPIEDTETLDPGQQMTEAIFLGLRKIHGIRISEFNGRFGCDFSRMFEGLLMKLSGEGYIHWNSGYVRLSREGLVLADSITSLFVRQLE